MSKNIWGGIVSSAAVMGDEKVLRVQGGAAELARLLDHWAAMPDSERPTLHGLSASVGPGTGPSLELLIGQGKSAAFAVLEVSPSASFPRPSAVWPHSVWWEEELRTFSGVEFSGMIPERDAIWRPL